MQLEHVDAGGAEIKELMAFRNLGDFDAKKIKENSEFLSGLDIEKEQSVKIARQLTSNRALQKVIENPETRNALAEIIENSIQEIQAAQSKSKL